jgi:hypothetical protein
MRSLFLKKTVTCLVLCLLLLGRGSGEVMTFHLSPHSQLDALWKTFGEKILYENHFLSFLDEIFLLNQNPKELSDDAFYEQFCQHIDSKSLGMDEAQLKTILSLFWGKFKQLPVQEELENALLTCRADFPKQFIDSFRLFRLQKLLFNLFSISPAQQESYLHKLVQEINDWKIDTCYSLQEDRPLSEGIAATRRMPLEQKVATIFQLIPFVHEWEVRCGFVPALSLKISIIKIGKLRFLLNEFQFLKSILGVPKSDLLISYQDVERALPGGLDKEAAMSLLWVPEKRVKKNSPSVLDVSVLPTHTIGIYFTGKSGYPYMLVSNSGPYFTKTSRHMVLFSIPRRAQTSMNYDTILDYHCLLDDPSMRKEGFTIGTNGSDLANLGVPEKQHGHLYSTGGLALGDFLPLYGISADTARIHTVTPEGVHIGLHQDEESSPLTSTIFEGTDKEAVSKMSSRFIEYLDQQKPPRTYVMYWLNTTGPDGSVIYRNYIQVRNSHKNKSTLFGVGMGVPSTVGVFVLESPLYLLYRSMKGFELDKKFLTPAAKFYIALRLNSFGNLETNSLETAIEEAERKINEASQQDVKMKTFWEKYVSLTEADRTTIKNYIRAVVETLMEKGYSRQEISQGLRIEEYTKSKMVDTSLVPEFSEDLKTMGVSFTEGEQLVSGFLTDRYPEAKLTWVTASNPSLASA